MTDMKKPARDADPTFPAEYRDATPAQVAEPVLRYRPGSRTPEDPLGGTALPVSPRRRRTAHIDPLQYRELTA